MKEKWKTWWWYHWGHVLLAAAVAALALYAFLPGLLEPKPDCTFAVVSPSGLSDENTAALELRLRSVAGDINGDGSVLVKVNVYRADLSGAAEAFRYEEAARLDADLVGGVSGIFLLEDPGGFARNTAVPVEPGARCAELPIFDGIALPEGMVVTVRSDAPQACRDLYERILSG